MPGPWVKRCRTLLLPPGRAGSIIEIQALRALALAACADHASGLGALAEAVRPARPQG